MQEHQITVKNLAVNYKLFGQGQPLLVLHGWGSNSDRWQATAQILGESGVCVIIPDLPGFGKSEEPKLAWNLDRYVEWVSEFTQQVPQLQKDFCLLGHSFGGSLAVKFAIKYTQRIPALFLVSAAAVRKLKFSKKIFYYLAKTFKVFSFLPGYAFGRKVFYKFILRKSDYPYQKGIMKDTYVNVVSEDLSQRLSFVRVPTAIIWGGKDTLTPPSDGEFIHQKIRNSKFIVLPDARHSLQIDKPEELAATILKHLAPVKSPGEIVSLKSII